MRHTEPPMMRALAAVEDFRGWAMRRLRLEFDDSRQEERYREESFEEARASVFTRRARAPNAVSVARIVQSLAVRRCGRERAGAAVTRRD